MASWRYRWPRAPRGARGRPAWPLGIGLLLVAHGSASGCAGHGAADAPTETVESAEEALVHACWPAGTPEGAASCAGGFSYTLDCPGAPGDEGPGCGGTTRYTAPNRTLAEARADAAGAWAALGGQGQPIFRAPLVCTSCTDTAAVDADGCWPPGTPDAQKTCAGGYSYAIECHARQVSAACPISGYEQTTCTEFNTCVDPSFGVASRGPRAMSATLTGHYIQVRQCWTDPETHHTECDFVPKPALDRTCVELANAEKGKLPAADAALVTYHATQGPTQGDGDSDCWASCNITFANWPTYQSGAGPVCGVKRTYACDDPARPLYASCRAAGHPVVNAIECGPELRTGAPGSSLSQARSDAQGAWTAAGGVGPVIFTVPPVCTSCTDLLPTTPQNGLTPGRTAGSLGVSADGAGTYAMPLWVPEGRAGLAPALGLSYSSRAGNGLLGAGFSLVGLSQITRCPKTLAQDEEARGVQMNVTDRFCLDGQQLVAVGGGVYGAYGTEYRTENDTFNKVVSLESDGYGPTAFRAYLKDGRILTFGGEVSARVEGRRVTSVRDASGSTASVSMSSTARQAWLVAREEDRAGNFIRYAYGANAGTDWQRESERWPTEIAYTGHGPTGRAPTRFVRFSYENRPDVEVAYVSGLPISSSRRLARVEVWGPSPTQQALLRSYRLRYANASISGRSQLVEAQECDGTGVCKRPTRFEWSQGSFQFERRQVGRLAWQDPIATKSYAAEAVFAGDVDGDGKDDLMARVVTGWQYQWAKYTTNCGLSQGCSELPLLYGSSPAESADTQSVWIASPRLVDVDGDGRADFWNLAAPPGASQWRWLRWKHVPNAFGGSFAWDGADGESGSTWTSAGTPSLPLIYFADLDGDGLPEAVRTHRQGSGYTWAFRPNTNGALGEYVNLPNIGALVDSQPYTARIDDSGRTAFLAPEVQVSSSGVRFLQALQLGASGMEQVPTTLVADSPSSGGKRHWFVDVNGDGLDDAVTLTIAGGTPLVSVNSGNGFLSPVEPGLPAAYRVGPFLPFSASRARPGVYVADLDFDGHQDLVLAQNHDGREKWLMLSLRGGAWVPRELDVPLGEIAGGGPVHTALLDWNGDGLTDIAQGEKDASGTRWLVVYTRKGSPPDLLQAVVDGAEVRSELVYGTLSEPSVSLTQTPPALLPTQSAVHPSIRVVKELRLDDGLGGLNRYVHRYGDGRRDTLRGWLGFQFHSVTDAQTSAETYTTYDVGGRVGKAYPYAGRPVHQRASVTLESGLTHVSETFTYYDTQEQAGGKVRFAYPHRTVSVTTDQPAGQPAQAIVTGADILRTYDADGNLTTSTMKRMYGGQPTGEQLVTATTYVPRDAGRWLIGLPATRVTTHTTALGATATRTLGFEHDPITGHLLAEVVEPGDAALQRRTDVQRNPFGLPSRITLRDAQGKTRSTAIAYDSAEEAFPAVVTNGLGHQARVAHHPGLGVVVASTAPSGAQTRYQYDGFGRLRAVDSPDGSDAQVSYGWAPGGMVEVRRQHSDGSEEIELLDRLDRVVLRQATGFDGLLVSEERAFDTLGRLAASVAPHAMAELGQVTSYTYDRMGRLLAETRPDASMIQYRYLPDRREKTDANGNASYVRYDAAGRVVESADDPYGSASLVTRFVYGPFDLPRQAQVIEGAAARLTTTMTYDGLGRRTSLAEYYGGSGSAGYREDAQYDAFGQLVRRVDAKGQATSYEYDVLGRILRKAAPEGDTRFTWDGAPGAGVGHLASSVSADGVATSYAYDGLGRLVDTTTTIDGRSYTTSRAYDAQGRLSQVAYPSVPNHARFGVRYAYNAFGHLAAAMNAGDGGLFWSADSVDARGNVTFEHFGNGVSSHHGFDPVRFVPVLTETFDSQDLLLQDLAFDFDPNGNLIKRQDHMAPVREDFTYDSHNRLATWRLEGPHVDSTLTNYVFTYDGLGRLQSRMAHQGSGPEMWIAYDTSGARNPYAPVESEVGGYTYDANGNRVTDGDRTVAWNSFNLPRRVDRSAGGWASYRYDASQARAVKVSSSGETTTYVEGLYERRATAGQALHVFHVEAAGRPVAQVTWKEQGGSVTDEEVSYLHTDQLGSVDVISDAAGQLRERLRFDVAGARANPKNPPYPPETPGSGGGVRTGYTGHEMEDDLGLVNMRGRIYDPALGHFLSRDPVYQAPFDPRAYSRYAYVRHNPMSAVDPSGFEDIGISTQGPGYQGNTPGTDMIHFDIVPSSPRLPKAPPRRNSDDNLNGIVPEPPPVPEVRPTPAPVAPASAPVARDADRRSTWQKFKDGHYFGTGFGEDSALYYAKILDDPNAGSLEVAGAWVGGSFASLWTADTYLDTVEVLATAGEAAVAARAEAAARTVATKAEGRLAKWLRVPEHEVRTSWGLGPKDAQKAVWRGKAPKAIDRIDNPKVKGEQWHAHGPDKKGHPQAVNVDGTLKHGDRAWVTQEIRDWLTQYGWDFTKW